MKNLATVALFACSYFMDQRRRHVPVLMVIGVEADRLLVDADDGRVNPLARLRWPTT